MAVDSLALLLIDVGNTHMKFAVGDVGVGAPDVARPLRFVRRIATQPQRTADELELLIRQMLAAAQIAPGDLSGSVISCVVPTLAFALREVCAALVTKSAPLLLEPGVKSTVKIAIDNPAQLGSDMVAAAVAVAARYPLPCVVFSLGTATTAGVVDRGGVFLGGALAPGVGISLAALSESASLLPDVALQAPLRVLGTNTVDSMRAGLVLGTAAMLDGLADRIADEVSSPIAAHVATGGFAKLIAPCCRHDVVVDEHLVLDGLRMIYAKNRVKFV